MQSLLSLILLFTFLGICYERKMRDFLFFLLYGTILQQNGKSIVEFQFLQLSIFFFSPFFVEVNKNKYIVVEGLSNKRRRREEEEEEKNLAHANTTHYNTLIDKFSFLFCPKKNN